MTETDEESSQSGSSNDRESLQDTWREDGTIACSVIDAIAALTGTPPSRLQPLYETIDPDALDRVLEPASETPRRRSTPSVSFCHEGCHVTTMADGGLTVTLQTDDQ